MFDLRESLRKKQIVTETKLSPDDAFSEEYMNAHEEEIGAICEQMASEPERRECMEHDAGRQIENYQREMRFHGEKYGEMKAELTEVFRGGAELLYTPEVYKAVAAGILTTLGVSEGRLPEVRLVADEEEIGQIEEAERVKMITARGRYVSPLFKKDGETKEERERRAGKYVNEQARRNGQIDIFLPNFHGELEPEKVFTTLGHECYHAYQENRLRGKIEPKTFGEAVAMVAYKYGKAEYVAARRSGTSYRRQGYETSARLFGEQTMPATLDVIKDAIQES